MTEQELAAAIRSEKRATFGTGRLRTRYKRCHEIAARAITTAPPGTVMVQGTDHMDGSDLDQLGLTREHSWLELADGRTWDPVACEFGTLRIVSASARTGRRRRRAQDLGNRVLRVVVVMAAAGLGGTRKCPTSAWSPAGPGRITPEVLRSG